LLAQVPKFTFSRISRQQQANGGIGWSDDGIAKYHENYDLVEGDRRLRGDTFNQELLKVHQRRCQKNKKGADRSIDNDRAKKRMPRDDLKRSAGIDCGPVVMPL
jgi:hypothetical protein